MKELSIEEKAKRYDEAIEVAQRFYNNSVAITKKGLEDIFPELKESEDEKVRKAIYNCVKWFGFDSCFFKDVSQEECLSWLEKQGEQKPAAWSEEDEKHIMAIDLAVNRCDGKWNCCGEKCPISEHSPWLKSLRPQNTWKPSDEQINSLWDAIVYVEGCNSNFKGSGSVLENLYNDLKKLKG